jgi:hypothetical protein
MRIGISPFLVCGEASPRASAITTPERGRRIAAPMPQKLAATHAKAPTTKPTLMIETPHVVGDAATFDLDVNDFDVETDDFDVGVPDDDHRGSVRPRRQGAR